MSDFRGWWVKDCGLGLDLGCLGFQGCRNSARSSKMQGTGRRLQGCMRVTGVGFVGPACLKISSLQGFGL